MEIDGAWPTILEAFKASPDYIKALWVAVPPAFLLGLVLGLTRLGVFLRDRRRSEGAETPRGELVLTVERDGQDRLMLYRHGAHPLLLLLPLQGGRPDSALEGTPDA